jgi:acyl-coenzyme A synthetase/AMP-(fatty) acid ligase
VVEKVADITEPNSCVGKILQGNEVKIVGEGGETLPAGKEGQIAVRNNITLTGYLNQSPDDKSLNDGWFYPGDIGYLDQEGELYIVARERDIVNVGGMKVNVNDYDRMIKSHPMVEDGVCFAMNINEMYPEIIALIKLKAIESPRTSVSQLKEYLNKGISLGLPKIVRVYFSEDLPVNPNGKINRKDLEQFTANLKPFNLR